MSRKSAACRSMPGVGLVQETAPGFLQTFLPFDGADVVAPLLLKAPTARRDEQILALRAAMSPALGKKPAPAVTVGGGSFAPLPLCDTRLDLACAAFDRHCERSFSTLASLAGGREISLTAQCEASVLRQDAREAAGAPEVAQSKKSTSTPRTSRRKGPTSVTKCN